MKTLFDDLEPPLVTCMECEKFAAGARDPTGWLFAHGKGYCTDDRHPGGTHNVVQSIVSHKICPYFERAAPDKIEARLAYWKKVRKK